MYTNANKRELLQLARDFYNITRILISIYDDKGNLLCTYPETFCDFCREIRKIPELTEKCLLCDRSSFDVCRSTRQTYIYHCHMGLVEVATPIICNHVVIGYMLFGQITDSEDKSAILPKIESAVQSYPLSRKILTDSLATIPYYTGDSIRSIAKLLEMCANYIWLNHIISIRNEGVAYGIDLYMKEHIRDDLSAAAFCRHFHISKSTLYDICKKNFGCSISEYVSNYRNECARELLKEEGKRVSDVAEAVGVDDVNYFIRLFKKKNGVTPKAYQKNCRPRRTL